MICCKVPWNNRIKRLMRVNKRIPNHCAIFAANKPIAMIILANDGLAQNAIDMLTHGGHTVLTDRIAQEQLAGFINENKVDALLVRSATKVRKDLIDACPGLKAVGRGGVGMDNIDVAYAESKGLFVFNTPASSSDSVAELVFAHLFSLVRFLHDANRNMPLDGDTKFSDLKKAYSKGTELRGKTLGIIGFGRIGQSVARMALGLGMKVVAADRHPGHQVEVTVPFFDGQSLTFSITTQTIDEVLKASDMVSLHIPGSGDKALLGAKELGKMKKGAFLVNAARGGVVDETALLEALNSGHLAGAGLDVFHQEPTPSIHVLMHPSVSLTPHIGAATEEAQDRIGEEIAQILLNHASGKAKA
jgi:D-3-phosphoglycerate dehydrogenase